MKKSERLYAAMLVVVDTMKLSAEDKLEILGTLAAEKSIAEYVEKTEQEKEV